MDSKRVLYFLDLLANETIGHESELAEIYKRALEENDDVIHLMTLLSDYTYYKGIGNGLYENGKSMLDMIFSNPTNALNILPQLKQAHETIDNQVRVCDELMRSPFPFFETISVLKKKDTYSYMRSLRSIASGSVYLMMLYGGLGPIRNLTWDDTVGIQEMIYAINTKFLPALCSVKRPNYSWIIRRKKLGGRALFGGDSYFLNYANTRSVEILCSALHKEPIGTHAFLNIDAYETGECDVPFCWGIGNIISVSPDKAIGFLQKDVATKLRSPKGDELKRRVPAPFECAKQLSDGVKFCITPDELVLAMNQWQTGHEIEVRKRMHNCLFCGKYVNGNKLVCPSHFTTELR